MKKYTLIILGFLTGCHPEFKRLGQQPSDRTPNSPEFESAKPDDPELMVIDDKCCCILLPFMEGWTDCKDCFGFNPETSQHFNIRIDTEIEWRDSRFFYGPDIPYPDPDSDVWMVDMDEDGDIDMHDVAYYSTEFNYGVTELLNDPSPPPP